MGLTQFLGSFLDTLVFAAIMNCDFLKILSKYWYTGKLLGFLYMDSDKLLKSITLTVQLFCTFSR